MTSYNAQIGERMLNWTLKQLAQIMVRYAIALAVALVVGSLGHFLIFDYLSGSFLAKTIVLPLLSKLILPSVLLWHLVTQFLPIIRHNIRNVELKSALIAGLLILARIDVFFPGSTFSTVIGNTLFVGTFIVAAGLCGYVMDWLKTKEWKLCRFIVT
jgi:hypothetical protein